MKVQVFIDGVEVDAVTTNISYDYSKVYSLYGNETHHIPNSTTIEIKAYMSSGYKAKKPVQPDQVFKDMLKK